MFKLKTEDQTEGGCQRVQQSDAEEKHVAQSKKQNKLRNNSGIESGSILMFFFFIKP